MSTYENKRNCKVQALISSTWEDLGATVNGFRIKTTTNKTHAFQSHLGGMNGAPSETFAGGNRIELEFELQEISNNVMKVVFPEFNVTGSGANYTINTQGKIVGDKLTGYTLRLKPHNTSDTWGAFFAECFNINPIDMAENPEDLETLTLNFICQYDDTQASGEEVFAISTNASSNISGWS